MTDSGPSRIASLREGEGEIAGISYRIRGVGPPLVLLPMFLAPSQWEPLVPRLSERYCTITLGGAAAAEFIDPLGGYVRLRSYFVIVEADKLGARETAPVRALQCARRRSGEAPPEG